MPELREGDWFAVPLRAGGYAVGLIARAPRHGNTLFGYFFGPVRSELPTPEDVAGYRPEDAVLLCKVAFDAPHEESGWRLIASSEDWQRDAWPMPEFRTLLVHSVRGKSFVVRYADDDLWQAISRREIAVEEERGYPADVALPDGYLELYLGQVLGTTSAASAVGDELLLGQLLGATAVGWPVMNEDDPGVFTPEGVTHVLVVPPERVEKARRELAALGFHDVEEDDVDEDGMVWLLAFQPGRIEDLQRSVGETEEQLTAVARRVGGEYDGREWTLPPPDDR